MKVGTTSSGDQLAGQKRKLFRIALMAAFVLLLNMAVTITTSITLESWSKSTDLSLQCSFETLYTRDFDAYDFQIGQSVCPQKSVTFVYGTSDSICQSDCLWLPQIETRFMICSLKADLSPTDLANLEAPQEFDDYSW
jgi:hypothetical protein